MTLSPCRFVVRKGTEISKEGAMSLAMQVAYIFLCSPVNTIADLLIRGKED